MRDDPVRAAIFEEFRQNISRRIVAEGGPGGTLENQMRELLAAWQRDRAQSKAATENAAADDIEPDEETAEAAARYACEITKQDFEPRDIQDVIDEARDPSLRPTVWGLIATAFCAGVRHGRDGAK